MKVAIKDNEKHIGQICEKIESVYQLINKKWITLIIHVLLDGPKRFGEIHSIIPDLSKRMLKGVGRMWDRITKCYYRASNTNRIFVNNKGDRVRKSSKHG